MSTANRRRSGTRSGFAPLTSIRSGSSGADAAPSIVDQVRQLIESIQPVGDNLAAWWQCTEPPAAAAPGWFPRQGEEGAGAAEPESSGHQRASGPLLAQSTGPIESGCRK